MRSPPRTFGYFLAGITTFAVIVGCAKNPVSPTPHESGVYNNPTFARAPMRAGMSATVSGPLTGSGSVDGALGGDVVVGRFHVIVPPGAFQGLATITITVPDQSVVSCELGISPAEANGFATPVSLVADCQGVTNVNLANCGTLWFDPSINAWRTVGGAVVDLNRVTVTASLQHFSVYGVADLLLGKAGW